MRALLLYQDNATEADAAASKLAGAGHVSRCERVTTVLDGAKPIEAFDIVIVFSETYREDETYEVCRRVREVDVLRDIPLLVGVNMYQMPLANRVKGMRNADFIFIPLDTEDLVGRFEMLAGEKTEEQENRES